MKLKNDNLNPDGTYRLKNENQEEEPVKVEKKKSRKKKGE